MTHTRHFGAWLYSFEKESWIVVWVRKKNNVEIIAIQVGLQRGIKVKLRILLKTFIQFFEHAECIVIDLF